MVAIGPEIDPKSLFRLPDAVDNAWIDGLIRPSN